MCFGQKIKCSGVVLSCCTEKTMKIKIAKRIDRVNELVCLVIVRARSLYEMFMKEE